MADDTSKSDKRIDLSNSCRFYLEKDQLRAVCPSKILEEAVHAEPKRIIFELEPEKGTEPVDSGKSEPKEIAKDLESKKDSVLSN